MAFFKAPSDSSPVFCIYLRLFVKVSFLQIGGGRQRLQSTKRPLLLHRQLTPATASTATNHADVSSTTSTSSTCVPPNFTSSWSILGETTGIKSEIRSPGLADSEVAALSQDPLAFYGTAAELGNLYDKEYSQSYSAQQYYNRLGGFLDAFFF